MANRRKGKTKTGTVKELYKDSEDWLRLRGIKVLSEFIRRR
jgi:hypothetical protein